MSDEQTIVVKRHPQHYYVARWKGRRGFEPGRTRSEAIGELLRTHPRRIQIEYADAD